MLKNELMKTNQITRRFNAGLLATVASLLCLGEVAQAQPSPAGDWDIILGGQRRGTAKVTFFTDFTLSGYQISTVPQQPKSPSVNPRTGTIDTSGGSVTIPTGPRLIGEGLIEGIWSFDLSGRVIGSYTETTSISEGGTNQPVVNAYTFRGLASPNRSLNLKVQGSAANLSWTGRPSIPLLDLSGSYYGYSIYGGVNYLEFFTLSPTATPNVYDVMGSGPNYSYSGTAMLLRQKNFSMVTGSDDGTNTIVRSVTGLLGTARLPAHGNLLGQQSGVLGNVVYKINP